MYRFYRFMYGLVGFSRSQTNAFLLFLPLMAAALLSRPLYEEWRGKQVHISPADLKRLDSLTALLNSPTVEIGSAQEAMPVAFDPNTASTEQLATTGLAAPVQRRILNYRAKGGRFRMKSDLLKIYGVDSAWYFSIRTSILLPDELPHDFRKTDRVSLTERTKGVSQPSSAKEKADLNTADTAALRKVYGIGAKLAERIIRYRAALGGFVSMSQLYEVYRLDSAVISSVSERFFISKDFKPALIDVNTATPDLLAAHPYLSSRTGHAIVAYRFQHGEFQSLEDLRKISSMDSSVFRKILPYLRLSGTNNEKSLD